MTTSTITPAGIAHHDDAGEYIAAYAVSLDNGRTITEVSDLTDAQVELVIAHIQTHDGDLVDRCREWAHSNLRTEDDENDRAFLRLFAGRFEEMAEGQHFELP